MQVAGKRKKTKKKKAAQKKSKKTSSSKPSSASLQDVAVKQAKQQREISISEFFSKNRHLLGFDNPKKALLTTVKEAVDNSLDACEDARLLPEVAIQINPVFGKDKEKPIQDRYLIVMEDNGPGILKSQIPNIFGKLLYGSKFHQMKQSRGQQGIGISAAAMYGQITTGKSFLVISKTAGKSQAQKMEIRIDTKSNKPVVAKDALVDWEPIIQDKNGKPFKHGTHLEVELKGKYYTGKQSVEDFLRQTMVACPHLSFYFQGPDGKMNTFPRQSKELPEEPLEIKPHPHGVEFGIFIKMLQSTIQKKIRDFLTRDFSRVGPTTAKKILESCKIKPTLSPARVYQKAEELYQSLQEYKIPAPPTNCLSPIGDEGIILGLQRLQEADFYTSTSRRPVVYRGNPFIIEVGLAYGGDRIAESQVEILRFANRVPLLYQQAACGMTKQVIKTDWRKYGMSQPGNSLPVGALTIFIHMASVWVPFTSESKEAIADYPEIGKEVKLALMDAGRKLGIHIRKQRKFADAQKKQDYIEKYLPHVGIAIQEVLGISDKQKTNFVDRLRKTLERERMKGF